MLSLFKQTAVHRSFAIGDNLGEVSAKAQVCYNFSYHVSRICFGSMGYILTFGVGFRFKQYALITLAYCLLHF